MAYDGDTAVGFADLYPKGDEYLVETAVRKSHRGLGLSPKLVRLTIEKIMANREKDKRVVWEFSPNNEKSERAAIRAGFKRVGIGRYALAL